MWKKLKKTNFKRYGCLAPAQNKDIKEKIKETNLKKYGTVAPGQNEKIKDKIKKICVEKYGVEHPAQNNEIHNKMDKTNLGKYGVKNPFQSEEIRRKMYRNNKYGTSKQETQLFQILKENWDPNLDPHPIKDKFILDIYSPKYDLYIQFDGDYWHGKLHTPEELAKTKQGKVILETVKRDQVQNQTIPNLIRIRESEFKNCKEFQKILKLINQKYCQNRI